MKVRTGIKAGAVGMGDVVAEVTRVTGLDQLAKMYEQTTGQSCGCEERRQKLNELFPLTSGQPG